MFCENCGKKNEDNVRFCENCGAPMETVQPAPAAPVFTAQAPENTAPVFAAAAPKKPMSLKNKIILIVIAALVVILGALYGVGKVMTDPKKMVEKYAKSLSVKDYATAYSFFDIKETEFTSKEMFAERMKGTDTELTNANNFAVVEIPGTSPLMKSFQISYTARGSSSPDSITLNLMKQPDKKWLIFDSYKIVAEELIANDVSIVTLKGTEVSINNKKIADSYITEDEYLESSQVKYVIPSIFEGEYDIKISGSFIKESVQEDTYLYDDSYIDLDYFDLTEEATEELYTISENFFKDYFNGIHENKDFNTQLSKYLASDAEVYDANEYYNDLIDTYHGNRAVSISAGFEEFDCSYGTSYSSYSGCEVYVNADYSLVISDETSTENYEEYGYMTLYFIYEDGQWLISEIGSVF